MTEGSKYTSAVTCEECGAPLRIIRENRDCWITVCTNSDCALPQREDLGMEEAAMHYGRVTVNGDVVTA